MCVCLLTMMAPVISASRTFSPANSSQMTAEHHSRWADGQQCIFIIQPTILKLCNVIFVAGVGYHLYIVKNPACIAENILETIKVHVPEVELESNVGAELSFVLPKEQSAKFEKLFDNLEKNQDSLGIGSFGMSVTTLEEVFLK